MFLLLGFPFLTRLAFCSRVLTQVYDRFPPCSRRYTSWKWRAVQPEYARAYRASSARTSAAGAPALGTPATLPLLGGCGSPLR